MLLGLPGVSGLTPCPGEGRGGCSAVLDRRPPAGPAGEGGSVLSSHTREPGACQVTALGPDTALPTAAIRLLPC